MCDLPNPHPQVKKLPLDGLVAYIMEYSCIFFILLSNQVREGTLAALVMLRGFLNAVEPLDETNSQV